MTLDTGAAVVARQTARRAVRSGVMWGYVFGAYVASSSLGYASVYRTPADRRRLAEQFSSNGGVSAIVGPAHAIDTVAGYTAWKCLAVLSVVGAVWGLLTGTKLLRGEEEAGRWELLLAGRTTRRGAAAQALAGLAAGAVSLFAVSATVDIVVGRSSEVAVSAGAMAFMALAASACAVVFLAVGALASQLSATRRQASAWGGAFLGVCYVLRMVADSEPGLGWLRWTTPLGWVEELRPLTGSHVPALVPLGAMAVALGAAAVHLAGSRDLMASIVPDRSSAAPHTRLLFGPAGLDIRLARPTLAGWAAAIAGMGAVYGSLAVSAGKSLADSPSIAKVLARLGEQGQGTKIYLGVIFLIMAVLVSLLAAGQVTATRQEEATGRLEHLLVRPLSRARWLAERFALAVTVVVSGGLAAGLFVLLGSAGQHTGVSPWQQLQAGLNIVPPALLVLGAGVLTFGVWPRATTLCTYGLLAWSFLIELVGGAAGSNHWLLDTSVFHHMASVPAAPPDWATAAVTVVLAGAAAMVGAISFLRRDLAGE